MNRPRRSLRRKLILTMAIAVSFIGLSISTMIAWLNIVENEKALAEKELDIRESLRAKGTLLAENHALALKNPVLDNAFSDVRALVEGAVADDSDLLYGLFLSADELPFAYVSPDYQPNPDEPVDKDGWRELKLPAFDTDDTKLVSRDVALFGDEIIEFSMPIVDPDEGVLGRVYYGVSTSRMTNALNVARQEADARLRWSLVFLGGLVLLNGALGLVLVGRQARKITQPLAAVTAAAESLAKGDHDTRVHVQSDDEVQTLAQTFNQMAGDLKQSYGRLEEMNRTLENKVKLRTAELATRNRDMRIVLDHVRQGLATVRPDGTLAPEFSAILHEWFGEVEAGSHFWHYASRLDKKFAANFEGAFMGVSDGFMPREVTLDQLPTRMNSPNRFLEVSYVDLSHDEEFRGILAVIVDITEQLARERSENQQREVLAIVRQLIRDKSRLQNFLTEIDRLVTSIVSGALDDEDVTLRRTVHSLKGGCRQLELNVMASLCHQIEDHMEATCSPPSPEEKDELERHWTALRGSVQGLLGEQRQGVEIPESELNDLIRELQANKQGSLAAKLVDLELEPVHRQLEQAAEAALAVAQKLGKAGARIVVQSNGLRIDNDRWNSFWPSFLHVVNNAVDHGLPMSTHGDSEGLVQLIAECRDGNFIIEVRDNGKGINWDSIRRGAAQRGLPHETQAHLVDALFADRFSTRAEVSEISGRGVGMGAAKATCEEMGGRIEIDSTIGKGTSVRFVFPEGAMAEPAQNRIALRLGPTPLRTGT